MRLYGEDIAVDLNETNQALPETQAFQDTPNTDPPPVQPDQNKDMYLPLGPYADYKYLGEIPEPKDPSQNMIDPRTNITYGRFSEEEIADSVADTMATALTKAMEPQDITPTEQYLNWSIENTPQDKEVRTGIWDLAKDTWKMADMNYRSGEAGAKYRETGDEKYLQESQTLKIEAGKLREEGIYTGHGLVHESMLGVVDMAGFLKNVGTRGAPEIASATMIGAGTGFVAGGPMGAIVGGASMGGLSLKAQMVFESSNMQGGSLYVDMLDEGVDREVADELSQAYGFGMGVSDMMGITVLLKNAGISGGIAERIAGVAVEGGTEATQSLLEDVAIWHGKKKTAEKNGEEFTDSLLGSIDVAKAQQSARAGILAGAGISTPGAVTKYGAASINLVRAMDVKNVTEEKVTAELAKDQAELADTKAREDKPTINTLDDETGVVVEGAPLSDLEVDQAQTSEGVTGTDITDGHLDDIVMEDDVEVVDAAIDEVINKADASYGTTAVEFFDTMRTFRPAEEVDAVEALMNARANSAGVSVDQYINDRQIELQKAGVNDAANGSIVFTQEGGAIITAFQGNNASTVPHELGHIFRRDLAGPDLAAAEKWVGIDPGGRWDEKAEEQFARGWELYLSEGKAPSKELETVFNKFTKWILGVYKAVRNPSINVELSPEIKRVFDNLLVKQQGARAENNAKELNELLQAKEVEQPNVEGTARTRADIRKRDVNAARDRMSAIVSPEDMKGMTAKQLLKAQIRAHRQIMRDLWDAGEKVGYQREKAKLKALLVRRRRQAAVQNQHTLAKKNIEKLLRKNQPKGRKRSKKTGRMSAVVQDTITDLYEEIKGIKKQKSAIALYLDKVVNADSDVPLTDVEIMRNRILEASADRSQQGVQELRHIRKELTELIATGKSDSPLARNLIRSRALVVEAVPDIIGSGVDPIAATKGRSAEQAHQQRQKKKSLREKIATMTFGRDTIFGWGGLMDVISGYSTAPMGKSTLRTQLDFFDAREQKETEMRIQSEAVFNAYTEAYGLKTDPSSQTAQLKFNAAVNTDMRKDIDVGLGFEINRSQLRQYWMYMQDPTLMTRLNAQGITREVREQIGLAMTEQDKAFSRSMMEMFQNDNQFQAINEVYRRNHGVNLEQIPNYVPIHSEAIANLADRTADDAKGLTQFQADRFIRRTPGSAGSLKKRAADAENAKIIVEGDIGLFQNYSEQMAHFKSFADIGRLANTVITDKYFKAAVKYEYGEGIYNSIEKNLKDILSDARTNGTNIAAVDRFRSAFVTSTIGMSAPVFAKQLISISNFANEVPLLHFANLSKDLRANLKMARKILDADFIKNRQGGMDRDLKQATNSKEYQKFRINPTFKNLYTFNVRWGDKLAIALGGAIHTRYLQKQINPDTGKKYTEAQAMREMFVKAVDIQQAGYTERLSNLQRGNSINKIMTTYSTGPVQAFRKELEAIRGRASGRMSKADFSKTMFINHALVPAMYSLAASFVAGDEPEDYAKKAAVSTILGPIGSMYSGGRIVANLVRQVFGMTYYQDSGPFADVMQEVGKVMSGTVSADFENLDLDDYSKMVQGLLTLNGVGIPVNKMTRMATNAARGEVKDAITGANPDN